MEGTKRWYESKTIIAGLVAALGLVNQMVQLSLGYSLFSNDELNLWINSALGLVGAVYSVYGRVVAQKRITQ